LAALASTNAEISMNQEKNQPESPGKKRKKKVFKNFADYWFHVKSLSEDQRRLIVSSLSPQEQKSLRDSYEKGGWADLFMRNACDYQLNHIKEKFEFDMLALRVQILSGKPQLMQKGVWRYVNGCFDKMPWEHISYIFNGIIAEDYKIEEGYVKLSKYENIAE
jgi:hypothetical protein